MDISVISIFLRSSGGYGYNMGNPSQARGYSQKTIKAKSIEGTLQDLTKLDDLSTECRVPQKDNPFMNPKLTDYGNNKSPSA